MVAIEISLRFNIRKFEKSSWVRPTFRKFVRTQAINGLRQNIPAESARIIIRRFETSAGLSKIFGGLSWKVQRTQAEFPNLLIEKFRMIPFQADSGKIFRRPRSEIFKSPPDLTKIGRTQANLQMGVFYFEKSNRSTWVRLSPRGSGEQNVVSLESAADVSEADSGGTKIRPNIYTFRREWVQTNAKAKCYRHMNFSHVT